MAKEKTKIKNQNGEEVEAASPIIISASRSTDIPAFYSDWLIKRMKIGYVKKLNPFNNQFSYISFDKARVFVFWSKNPKPIIEKLKFFDERNINYYFQFTMNDYDNERLEPNVPNIQKRIETFIELSEKIGKDKVIWRFDPLILTDKIGVNELLEKIDNIGNQIKHHTSKLVFSFADIGIYNKVQNNLLKNSIKYKEFNEELMNKFASGLQELNKKWGLSIGTCSEKIPLEKYGIVHNKCIDDDLMIKLFGKDKILMDFLGVRETPPDMFNTETTFIKTKNNKDNGQRKLCGCIISKDIGEYNTCPHLCEYCYANSSKESAHANWQKHKQNPNGETITN